MFSPFHLPLGMFGVGGPRNWFGDGSLGDVRITSASGAEASQDGGSTWTAITGWTRSGDVVLVPSIEDGDMVVLNCRSLSIEAGMTLTTLHRCRGLLVYTQRDAVISGSLSMSARGCHANPADVAVTSDTPVAPSCGHAVPAGGLTLRRLAKGQTDTDLSTDLLHGCGLDAVTSEAEQPAVKGGVVIRIPRVGGAGAAGVISADGSNGSTLAGAPGGGGSGGSSPRFAHLSSAGAAATCFSGGSGGGASAGQNGSADAKPYGGRGGDADTSADPAFAGAGNPPGSGYAYLGTGGYFAEAGTGGVLLLIVGGELSGSGVLSADGAKGGYFGTSTNGQASGAGSGGGAVVVLYAGASSFVGSIRADGGQGGPNALTTSATAGGDGAAGAVIGPIKIDPK
jgi:hypothetical protein